MPEPPRPLYTTEHPPSGPPPIELIRYHVTEAARLIDEWMAWERTNLDAIEAAGDYPEPWPWTEPELSEEALAEDDDD